MRIRPFQPSDLESVLNLWLSANLSAHAFLPASYWTSHREAVGELLPQAEVWVCQGANGALLGFAGLTGAYLSGRFVAEGFRSQGVGRALLNHVKARHARLTLHVYRKNCGALRFYRREGFRLQAEEREAATGEPEFLLAWEAPPEAVPLSDRVPSPTP